MSEGEVKRIPKFKRCKITQQQLSALMANGSLVSLNLALSGVGFRPGDAGAPLLEAMARGPVLPRLARLVLTEDGAETPVDEVRRLGAAATRALI